jgi:hypothetical protein
MPIAQWSGLAIPGPGELSPKRIAEDANDAFIAENEQGKFAPTCGFTFGDACEACMHYGKTDRDVRRSTATNYRTSSPSTCAHVRRGHADQADHEGRDQGVPQAPLTGPHSRRNTQR